MCILSQYVHQQYMKLSTISKEKNKFYKDISISYGLNSKEILNLSNIPAIDETEADRLIVENKSFESVDDPLNAHRAAGYKTTLVPEIPKIIEDDNVIMAPAGFFSSTFLQLVNGSKNSILN